MKVLWKVGQCFLDSIQKCIQLHKSVDSKMQNVIISEFRIDTVQPLHSNERINKRYVDSFDISYV